MEQTETEAVVAETGTVARVTVDLTGATGEEGARPEKPVFKPKPKRPAPPEPVSLLEGVTRLVVGGTVLGAEQLRSAARQTSREATSDVPSAIEAASEMELVRWAAIGLLFEAEGRVRTGLRALGSILSRLTSQAASTAARPIMRVPPLEPLRRRADDGLEALRREVVGWVERGRQEELAGRTLAAGLYAGTVDTVVARLRELNEVNRAAETADDES